MKSLFRLFDDRTMGFKLTTAFVAVILIPMMLLAYMSYKLIESRLVSDASEKAGMALKAAWTEYYSRGEQMRYGMLQAAAMGEIRESVKRKDKAYLKGMMTSWRQMRPYVDIWAVLDSGGRVIARANSESDGDILDLNGLVGDALSGHEPRISTEEVGIEGLRAEGNELIEKVTDNGMRAAAKSTGSNLESALVLFVVTPILDSGLKPVGAIVTGDVLNNDPNIPEKLANRFPGVFTTVSLNGLRVSTNLVDRDGKSMKITKIPAADVKSTGTGARLVEWEMAGASYISVFEPIKNNTGKVIGALDVSISKERLWALQRQSQILIALITAVGLVISGITAWISRNRITRPLRALNEKISAYTAGDRFVNIDVQEAAGTRDEIKTLAVSFNSMMGEVQRRDEENRAHLEHIQKKTVELSELNDELKKANEELELAYEETQSQTEELHAINEELKLLNEDLDRKNAELKKANTIITMEEEELKKAKEKLRLIYDSITESILLVDGGYNIIEANRYFSEKFGPVPPVNGGRGVYGFFGIEPPAHCPIKNAISSGKPVELEITTPKGTYMWHAYPFMKGENGTGKAVVYIKDITEQKDLLHKLIQSDKLSSLGELVSGVAHELNNPLTGIMCFSELLLENKALPEGALSKISRINDASHRCKKIIENLLTFARWKRPEKTYESMNRIVKNSVELRAYQLKVDNIEVELDLDKSLPYTMVDENQVQQVFLNLINNARDAIIESDKPGRIRISTAAGGDRLSVRFEDTGRGVPADVAARIFDPFFTTKDTGKGTGLGLSISYGIINEHGGSISFSSLKAGAAFTVELPITAIGAAQGQQKAPQGRRLKDARARGLKALVLDDEILVLELLYDFLNYTGFTVEKTISAKEALEKIREKEFDLIISDIKMPGIDGKRFYNELASIRPGAREKIIFVSGDSMSPETQEFLCMTGNTYLKKPFTIEELNSAISKFIP